MPASGEEPRRLTYHPDDFSQGGSVSNMVGWTPDGNRIVFSSGRAAYANRVIQLFTVAAEGGFASPVPLSRASEASFSADGTRAAYVLGLSKLSTWKRYRGGATSSIQIVRLSDSTIEGAIPRDNSNDFNPMWIGNTIYFLSDRNGPVTLFSFDLSSRQLKQVVENHGLDIKSAAASSDAIVYEQFGTLHVLSLASGQDRMLDIRPRTDFSGARPHLQKIDPAYITAADISPDGRRAAFAVRGEIITVSTDRGTVVDRRNLTQTANAVEREPVWSPDGKSIAYFSDASGEYALHIRDQGGRVTRIALSAAPTYYYSPSWSPDSNKIVYTDKDLNYWYIDLRNKTPIRIDTDLYLHLTQIPELAWSPDSRWVAYTRQLPSHAHAIFLYSLESARRYQVTDAMSDAVHPAFDHSGQYLYFTLSTDALLPLSTNTSRIARRDRLVTRHVCLVPLRKDLPLPLTRPEDDSSVEGDNETGLSQTVLARNEVENTMELQAGQVHIDFDGLDKRIVALPVAARNYYGLYAGQPGIIFLAEVNQAEGPDSLEPDTARIKKFDLRTLQTVPVLPEVSLTAPFPFLPRSTAAFHLSADGQSMLYERRGRWFLAEDGKPNRTQPPAEGIALGLEDIQVYVDPRTEWAHLYDQVWRDVRDFFYDPNLHGLDLEAVKKRYRPYLKNISTRDELSYLFDEMLGNLTAGHLGVYRPATATPAPNGAGTGLLGADYKIENGRYRFARVYGGESWNPELRAPLSQLGADVRPGEYLLAVNGREVRPPEDVYSFFQGTAGEKIVLSVGSNPDAGGARSITVIPITNEAALRNYAWVEDNRKKVDEWTNGRVGYLYLADVGDGGYQTFNRYYFAQSGKEALIVDARNNGGGWAADHIIDYLNRPLLDFFHLRVGRDITTPELGIFGPKVLIVNELAGSGGDHLAYAFRKAGIGPLVGKRTAGGLVGACAPPDDLLDGSIMLVSTCAFYTTDGAWSIENHGVPPDIEVENDPKAVRKGRDPQLEKSVEVVLELLKQNPQPAPQLPPFPNYQQSRRAPQLSSGYVRE